MVFWLKRGAEVFVLAGELLNKSVENRGVV